ncbi:DUF3800 domain-containing protein [Spirosoma litoris]
MENVMAFVDEYGNNSFDFDSQGTHFIVSAVIINQRRQDNIISEIENIRKKYFQTGEIKSNKVASNDKRRLLILRDLVKSDFSIYSVVVDKRKLVSEGFKYKTSFYKFLNGLVYNELFKTFPDLQLTVDEHGRNDFMRSFKKYVSENHQPDLFSGSGFYFSGSADNVLIQLADFISGTLGRCFDETKKSENSDLFLKMLQPRLISIKPFPNENDLQVYNSTIEDKSYDATIANYSVNLANIFIDKKKGRLSQQEVDQITCVKLLLLYFRNYGFNKYVSAREIINHLNAGRKEQMQEQYFRTSIIAKLRDGGIIIASNTSGKRKGYKLPSCSEDLYNFINHGNSMIIPILARIKKCRDGIKLVTDNRLDILDKPEYTYLRGLIEK